MRFQQALEARTRSRAGFLRQAQLFFSAEHRRFLGSLEQALESGIAVVCLHGFLLRGFLEHGTCQFRQRVAERTMFGRITRCAHSLARFRFDDSQGLRGAPARLWRNGTNQGQSSLAAAPDPDIGAPAYRAEVRCGGASAPASAQNPPPRARPPIGREKSPSGRMRLPNRSGQRGRPWPRSRHTRCVRAPKLITRVFGACVFTAGIVAVRQVHGVRSHPLVGSPSQFE